MNDLEPIEVVVEAPKLPGNPNQLEIDLGEEKPKAEATPAPAPAPTQTADDGIELLKRQLEEKRREAEEAKQQKQQAEMLAAQREREIQDYQFRATDSEHVALVNAIASFERDGEMLEKDYAAALEMGEYNKAAKIQRQMAAIESRLLTLTQGKEELEYRLKAPRPEPELPKVQPMPRDPVEERIAGLSKPSQDWIRSHPEVITDSRLTNKMTAAHYEALSEGINADTPDYFAFIESKLGLDGSAQIPVQAPAPVQRTQLTRSAAIAAAPVSRSASPTISSNGNSMTVTLTAEERQTARDLDMSDEEYAANKLYYMQRGDLGRR